MYNQLLLFGACCSLFIHGFFIVTSLFDFGSQQLETILHKKLSNQDSITLVSLNSYEQKNKAAQESPAVHPLPIPQSQAEPLTTVAQRDEPVIQEPQEKTDSLEKAPIEPPVTQKTTFNTLSLEEKKDLLKKSLLKKQYSPTKTTTKTNFFHHAQTVAQAEHKSSEKKELSAKISGLGTLKFLSYEEKLRSTLLNAFNIIKYRFPLTSEERGKPLFIKAAIDLVINKDGSIKQLYLAQSSGDTTFDKMILESIKYAAPFPPIPDHLNVELYRLGGMELHVNY